MRILQECVFMRKIHKITRMCLISLQECVYISTRMGLIAILFTVPPQKITRMCHTVVISILHNIDDNDIGSTRSLFALKTI